MDDGLPPTDDAGIGHASPASGRPQRAGSGSRAGRTGATQARRSGARGGRPAIDPSLDPLDPLGAVGEGGQGGEGGEGSHPSATRREGVLRNDRLDDDLDSALHRGPVVLPAIVPAEATDATEAGDASDSNGRGHRSAEGSAVGKGTSDRIGLFDDGADVIDVDPFAPGADAVPPIDPFLPPAQPTGRNGFDDLIVSASHLTPEPARPVARPGHGPRVRRVTRVVRHVDTWSVFKVAVVFNVFLYVVTLTSGVFLWQVAQNTGTIDNIERFFESFGWETFELHGGEIFHNAWVAGLFLVVGMTGFAVLMATLFNLITDLVGGIRISVLEEEVVPRDERGTNPARAAVLSRLERFGRGDTVSARRAGGRVGGRVGGVTNPFRRRQ